MEFQRSQAEIPRALDERLNKLNECLGRMEVGITALNKELNRRFDRLEARIMAK